VSQDSVLSKRGLPFFVPPEGPLGTRIRAFTEWLRREVACETLFILDSQGCPVSDHQPSPEVLAAALVLSDAAIRASRHVPSAGDGALHVDLADRKKLCVIHAETTRGHFSLGLVISDVIPTSSADRLRGTLKRCIEAEEGPSSYKGPVRAERW
jgi:hypothetical protein